ncbi:hypothetical protein BFN03_02335 [Rhodococcus sp. WMMA185]|uniref:hypothetical protein n=1 Tax=Rhodococcus sp. WMMA185 TaxID=679318 RepID=UPI00087809E0|nr:hypothetical protein [Rhodococcus sp. WMMA185]AOW91923.1 hypothetical protein BFN03_02335 [Rhodococcus sp. WMMA185]
MIRSIRQPLIVAATVGLVGGGFGVTVANAAPSETSIQAVARVTTAAPVADTGEDDELPTLGSLDFGSFALGSLVGGVLGGSVGLPLTLIEFSDVLS